LTQQVDSYHRSSKLSSRVCDPLCVPRQTETASVLREAVALYERYGFRRYEPGHLAARCDAAYYLDLPPAEPDEDKRAAGLSGGP
jgi:hypothetical protein